MNFQYIDYDEYIQALRTIPPNKIESYLLREDRLVLRPSGFSFRQYFWLIEKRAYEDFNWFHKTLKPFICSVTRISSNREMPCIDKERIQKLVEEGNTNGLIQLGDIYRVGRAGFLKDEAKAFFYYEKAANSGDLDGLYNVALCYDCGIGVPVDYTKSVQYLKIVCERGLDDAQYKLAWQYEKAHGVEKDLDVAFELLQKSADQGHVYSQYNLGVFYRQGFGTAADPKKAIEYYLKAASQGHSQAQNNLGYQYHNGIGVDADYHVALEWYTRAAQQGHDRAQYNLAQMYYHGSGSNLRLSVNFELALYWYTRSQHYCSSQKMLGLMYLNGEGTPKNVQKAIFFYVMAADQGDETACAWVNEMDAEVLYGFLEGEWPRSFRRMHVRCKKAVVELLLMLSESEYGIPREVMELVCKVVMVVWPREERHLCYSAREC